MAFLSPSCTQSGCWEMEKAVGETVLERNAVLLCCLLVTLKIKRHFYDRCMPLTHSSSSLYYDIIFLLICFLFFTVNSNSAVFDTRRISFHV